MLANATRHLTAPALLALGIMLALGNWYLQPERALAWASTVILLGGMAVALLLVRRHDLVRRGTGDSIRSAVVFAGLMLVIPLSTKLAAAMGAIADADLSRSATMVLIGAFFVYTGNALPKTLTPLTALQCDAGRVQAFQRFAGWTWVLTGLAFAIAWLVLPVYLAEPVSTTLLLVGTLMVVSQIVLLRRTRETSDGGERCLRD